MDDTKKRVRDSQEAKLEAQLQEKRARGEGMHMSIDPALEATPTGCCISLPGHGDTRLAQLEQLLSHDLWEPAPEHDALWAELKCLLSARPWLHTYLVPPEEDETRHIFLLDKGATPLHRAAAEGDEDLLAAILAGCAPAVPTER